MQEDCPGFGAPGSPCRACQRKKDSRGLMPSTPILKCEPSGFWPARLGPWTLPICDHLWATESSEAALLDVLEGRGHLLRFPSVLPHVSFGLLGPSIAL